MNNSKELAQIVSALEKHGKVNDWVVQQVRRTATSLYLVGVEPEAKREVRSEEFEVHVYCDHARGRGDARVRLSAADMRSLEARLEGAAFAAGLSGNPPFPLPKPGPIPTVQTEDQQLATQAGAALVAAAMLAQVMEAVEGQEDVRLCSMEVVIERREHILKSSTGIDTGRQDTLLTVELVIIARRGSDGEEAESQSLWQLRRAADLDLTALIKRQMQFAHDSLHAVLPPSGEFPVVVDAETLRPFFAPVFFRASAASKYKGNSPWKIGERVLGERGSAEREGEGVTILTDALLPFGVESRAFDSEGVPGQRVTLVREGVLENLIAEQRYAHYLGLNATGAAGNVVLNTGPTAEVELLAAGNEPIVRVVNFSFLNPDNLTGDVAAEIRLGYLITEEGITPIKGGTVSGNVFTALGRARLAREPVFWGDYAGPRSVRFEGLKVTGA